MNDKISQTIFSPSLSSSWLMAVVTQSAQGIDSWAAHALPAFDFNFFLFLQPHINQKNGRRKTFYFFQEFVHTATLHNGFYIVMLFSLPSQFPSGVNDIRQWSLFFLYFFKEALVIAKMFSLSISQQLQEKGRMLRQQLFFLEIKTLPTISFAIFCNRYFFWSIVVTRTKHFYHLKL